MVVAARRHGAGLAQIGHARPEVGGRGLAGEARADDALAVGDQHEGHGLDAVALVAVAVGWSPVPLAMTPAWRTS